MRGTRGLGWVDIMLLGVVLLWGGNFVVMKQAFEVVDRDVFNAARFALASLVALVLSIRAPWRRLSPRAWALVIAVGLLGNVAYQFVFAVGVDLTTPAKAAVLLATTPVWVALLGAVRGERVPMGGWIGMAVAVVGVAVLVADENLGGVRAGDLVMLGAAWLWAATIAAQRPALRVTSTPQFHATTMVVGALGLTAIAAPVLSVEALRGLTTPAGGFAVLYAGFGSLGLGFLAWSMAIRRTSPVHVANFQNLVPVVAIVAEWCFMPDVVFGLRHLVASALVIGGVTVTRRATMPRATPATAPASR